jgi:DNA-binding transcriptional LysR family regulator
MDLRQLQYFLAIVDHGGYHRAAEALLVSQPSLSQSIANLERELGVPLFHRVGRGVVLSSAGQDPVGRARTLVRDLEAARATVLARRGLQAGRVDVVSMPSPGIEPLTGLVSAFLSRHPDMAVNVRAAFRPEETLAAVRTGEAEIGLVGSREAVRAADLVVVPMGRQPLVLIVSPAHDGFGTERTVRREGLAGQPFVVSQQGSLMRWLIDDVIAGGTDARIVAEVGHRTSILPLVLAGVGHAVLPSAWTELARASGLRVLGIEPRVPLHVAVVARPAHLTPGAAAFLDLARATPRRRREAGVEAGLIV